MKYKVEFKACNEDGKVKYSLASGKLPPYHHIDDSGRIYAYYYPQYYAWAKRKINDG
jgi:hypothetical protein